MKKLFLSFLLFITAACKVLDAQDTLPKFSVKDMGGNRIILSWTNTFEDVRQISIQRSPDSLKNFKTILTVPDPTIPQNGLMDTKAPNNRMFYKLYILLDKGVYLFSDVKRPVPDTVKKTEIVTEKTMPEIPDTTAIVILNIPVKPPPVGYQPSIHIYTSKDGYVSISLPIDEQKKYSIKFFEEDSTFLFEIKEVRQTNLKIDKTNFYHAGWFWFELYENDKLTEKNKFYLKKDF